MDQYNRAWRDRKSPLTPLTPLSSQVFNFDNITPTPKNHLSLPCRSPVIKRRFTTHSTHYSQDFMRLRSVFSPNAQSTASENEFGLTKKIKQERNLKKVEERPSLESQTKRKFKRSSPVKQPTLSPRVRSLLNRTGNNHLAALFTRQEIDIQVLIQMTLDDLEALGVRGAKELKLAMDVIKIAKNFF